MLINPSKYIKKAIISASSPLPCYIRIPKNITTPNEYVLMDNVSLNEYARSKNCYEWIVSVDISVYKINPLGYDASASVDDLVEYILPRIKNITSDTIIIKNVDLTSSRWLNFDTQTNSINRFVISFEFWCAYQEGVTT